MASAIDPTKPVDAVPAVKADLRDNLQAAKDEIEELQTASVAGVATNANTAITVNAAIFGDSQFIRILCTFAGTVTPTFAGDVPAGKTVEFVAEGASTVMSGAPQVSGSATLVKPSSASHATTERYEATVYSVDTNTGSNARWRLEARL